MEKEMRKVTVADGVLHQLRTLPPPLINVKSSRFAGRGVKGLL